MIISVEEDGTARMVYDDDLKSLINKGIAETVRASHVEPVGNKWQVDMTPIGGPVIESLYENRKEALKVEVEWIEGNWL